MGSDYCEAVEQARRLGDGYSACVMAASAHALRTGGRGGGVREADWGWWVCVCAPQCSCMVVAHLGPKLGLGSRFSRCPPGLCPPAPSPHSAAAAILRALATVVAHFLGFFPPLKWTRLVAYLKPGLVLRRNETGSCELSVLIEQLVEIAE